jgi:hypothetical protein
MHTWRDIEVARLVAVDDSNVYLVDKDVKPHK